MLWPCMSHYCTATCSQHRKQGQLTLECSCGVMPFWARLWKHGGWHIFQRFFRRWLDFGACCSLCEKKRRKREREGGGSVHGSEEGNNTVLIMHWWLNSRHRIHRDTKIWCAHWGRYHVERLTVRRATIRRPTIKALDGRLSSSDCRLPTSDWPSGNMWIDMSPIVSRLARHSPKLLGVGGDGGLSTSGLIKSAWARVVILHLQLNKKQQLIRFTPQEACWLTKCWSCSLHSIDRKVWITSEAEQQCTHTVS